MVRSGKGKRACKREGLLARHSIAEMLQPLGVPVHWLVPSEAENVDQDDIDSVRAIGPNISVERVPDTVELLPYQKPDLFIERLIQLASGDDMRKFDGNGKHGCD